MCSSVDASSGCSDHDLQAVFHRQQAHYAKTFWLVWQTRGRQSAETILEGRSKVWPPRAHRSPPWDLKTPVLSQKKTSKQQSETSQAAQTSNFPLNAAGEPRHFTLCDAEFRARPSSTTPASLAIRISEIYPLTRWPTAAPEESQQAKEELLGNGALPKIIHLQSGDFSS